MTLKTTNKFFLWPVLMFFLILSTGCRVMLIGAYDQVTDQGIQQIQTDVTTLLVKMEKNVTDNKYPDNDYGLLKDNFTNIEGKIQSLMVRAVSLPKYSIVTSQIDALLKNTQDLELLSKTPIQNLKLLTNVQNLFNIQFQAMISLQNGLKSQK